MSAFRGVFVPSCIGLVGASQRCLCERGAARGGALSQQSLTAMPSPRAAGPTLFLRLPYIVALAGLPLTLVMIMLVGVVAFFTVSGANAILTNGRISKPGGAYLIISRTLGAEFGAAIGVLIAAEHILAVNLFLSSCAEILLYNTDVPVEQPTLASPDFGVALMAKSGFLLLIVLVAGVGPRRSAATAVLMWLVKMAAILLTLGSFLFRHASPNEDLFNNNDDDDESVMRVNATTFDFFTGPSQRTLKSNCEQHLQEGDVTLSDSSTTDFLLLFSLVYGPFSSLLCGLNFTGSVRNPGRNFPKGMLMAEGVGVAVFAVFAVVVSSSVYSLRDIPNGARDVMEAVCVARWIIVSGMLACCLGAALLHMTAATTTLLGLCKDELLPGTTRAGRAIGSWHSPNGNRLALVLAWAIAQLTLLTKTAGIHPILSIASLFLTAVLNLAVLILMAINPPSFRPRFKLYSKTTAIVGTLLPLLLMLGTDLRLGLGFAGVFLVVLILFTIFAPPSTYGELSQAILFHQVRKFLLQLSKGYGHKGSKARSNKYWRPSLLYFDVALRDPNLLRAQELHLLHFANELKKGGLLLIASLVQDVVCEASVCLRDSLEHQWAQLIETTGIKALPVITITPSLRDAVNHAAMLTGLGRLRPNTILLEWDAGRSRLTHALFTAELPAIVRDVQRTEMTLLIAQNFTSVSPRNFKVYRGASAAAADADDDQETGAQPDPSQTRFIDVVVFPIIIPSSSIPETAQTWNNHVTSITTSLMLVSCLRQRGRWRKYTRLRVISTVAVAEDVEWETTRWKLWLNQVRIKGTVVVTCVEKELNAPPSPGNEGSARQAPVSRAASSVGYTDTSSNTPPVLPPPILPSSPFYQLPRAEQLAMLKRQIASISEHVAMTFIPLCPPPAKQSPDTQELADIRYTAELGLFGADLQPLVCVHSSSDVLHTWWSS